MPMIASLPPGAKMIATGVVSPFLVPMKVTLMFALIVALPWVFYQLWAFVAPGLYAHEKRLVLPLVISSSLLFIAGVAFCYFLVFGRVFHFISEFAPTSIAVMPDIENYLDFVMSMCLAFGATFEVPVVVVILVRMGIVSVEKLKSCAPTSSSAPSSSPRSSPRRTWSASCRWPFRCACCSNWVYWCRRCSCA
jgi:sec-independent protein translocase protein TatC